MPPEANAPVLAGFLDYLRIEKGLARLSIAAYTTDIGQFAEFLEKRKRILLTACIEFGFGSAAPFSQREKGARRAG